MCLIWIANGPNLHFVHIHLFILLNSDLNICGCEKKKIIDRLVLQFYGCFACQHTAGHVTESYELEIK